MRLTDCFMGLIAYVVYFLKSAATRQPAFDKVKADIQRLIMESDECFKSGVFSQEDYDLARFAVFAWIDEAILNSSWEHRSQWQGEQLQRIYYRMADAGEIFFERLNTIGPHQRDVREVYYLCLAMGFTGRYCHEGDDYLLEQLRASNLKLLVGSSVGLPTLDKGELFPETYAIESVADASEQTRKQFPAFTIACLGFPVILFMSLYLIYRFVLSNVGEHLLRIFP
jgi:type VI secretion system protein ImpK